MRSRKLRSIRTTVWFLILLAMMATGSFAQAETRVSQQDLDDWFYSRLGWGGVIAVLTGFLVGYAHLCRIEYRLDALHVNDQARKKFVIWLISILAVGAVWLFFDAWLLFPLGRQSLTLSDAFIQVWLDYRTLLVLAFFLMVFTLLVAVSTRTKRTCRCRYAFVPWLKGR